MRVNILVDYPEDWTPHDIWFHRNEGSWCASNALDELKVIANEDGCLCNRVTFDVLDEKTGKWHNEYDD